MSLNVIFGAGKIARGFIAHLLFLGGEEFIFIDKAQGLVDLVNEKGRYTVNILGAPEKNETITGVKALSFKDGEKIIEAISKASAIFTAVGGKNLNEIVPFLTKGLEARFRSRNEECINIVTCENWKQPSEVLKQGILGQLDSSLMDKFNKFTGITEAVVMRSAIEAD